MNVLLDVCTPVQVRQAPPDHQVQTATKLGWGELGNGELLRAAEAAGFDLLIICDKNLRHQQNLADRKLAILEFWTNHRPTLEQYFELIRRNAETIRSDEYRELFGTVVDPRTHKNFDLITRMAPACRRILGRVREF